MTTKELANAIYNESYILDVEITKEQFINYFCEQMDGIELTVEKIVHAVAFCERSHDRVIRDILEKLNK